MNSRSGIVRPRVEVRPTSCRKALSRLPMNAAVPEKASEYATNAVTIVWAFVAYSLAFSGTAAFIGNLDNAFLHDVGLTSTRGLTIPDLLFMGYQATFCII